MGWFWVASDLPGKCYTPTACIVKGFFFVENSSALQFQSTHWKHLGHAIQVAVFHLNGTWSGRCATMMLQAPLRLAVALIFRIIPLQSRR